MNFKLNLEKLPFFPEDQNQESQSHRVTSQIEFKEGSLYGFPDIPGAQALLKRNNRNTNVGKIETIRVHKIANE